MAKKKTKKKMLMLTSNQQNLIFKYMIPSHPYKFAKINVPIFLARCLGKDIEKWKLLLLMKTNLL